MMRGIVFILLLSLFCSSPDGRSGVPPCGEAPKQRPPAPDEGDDMLLIAFQDRSFAPDKAHCS